MPLIYDVQHLKLIESRFPRFWRDTRGRLPQRTPTRVRNLKIIGPAGNIDRMTCCTR